MRSEGVWSEVERNREDRAEVDEAGRIGERVVPWGMLSGTVWRASGRRRSIGLEFVGWSASANEASVPTPLRI